MWSTIGATGAFALLGVVAGRVLIMVVALRGTKPSERPAIIRALKSIQRQGDRRYSDSK